MNHPAMSSAPLVSLSGATTAPSFLAIFQLLCIDKNKYIFLLIKIVSCRTLLCISLFSHEYRQTHYFVNTKYYMLILFIFQHVSKVSTSSFGSYTLCSYKKSRKMYLIFPFPIPKLKVKILIKIKAGFL